MSKPSSDVAKALARMPAALKAALKAQCAGDWARLSVDASGAITVHNQPVATTKRTPPAPKQAPKPAPAPTPTPVLTLVPTLPEPDWDTGESAELTQAMAELAQAAKAEPHCERCGRDGHYADECRTPASRWLARVTVPPPPVPAGRGRRVPAPDVQPTEQPERAPEPARQPEVARTPTPTPTPTPEPAPAPKPAPQPKGERWKQLQEQREREARQAADQPVQLPVKPSKGALRTRVELQALAALIGSEVPRPEPTVSVVHMSADERRLRAEAMREPTVQVPAPTPGQATEQLEATCGRLHRLCQNGLPNSLGYSYHPDVLALYGLDEQLCDAALRHPERVEIRPESFSDKKRYPVLGFYRGDVSVILGMKDPRRPAIIAVYVTSRLMADEHVVNHMGGGGRKREESGLPKTARQVLTRLQSMGALVDTSDVNAKAVPVSYKGQDLGSVSQGTVPRATCESDYQRMIRKMHAIDRREASVTTG